MVESDYTRLVTKLINDDSKLDEIERLNNVIKSWEIQLNNESFPIFKFIIEHFRFYSEKKSISTIKSINNGVSFLEDPNAVYVPFRTENRSQSSIHLFSVLNLSLPLNSNNTEMEKTSSVLKEFSETRLLYRNLHKGNGGNTSESEILSSIEELNDKILETESMIQRLEIEKQTIEELFKSPDYISGIQFRYDGIKKQLIDEKNKIKKLEAEKNSIFNEFERKYRLRLSVDKIIVFDDFLCSGESIKTFIIENESHIKALETTGIHIFFVVLETTKDGQEKIQNLLVERKITNITLLKGEVSLDITELIKQSFMIDLFYQEQERITSEFNLGKKKYFPDTAIACFSTSPNTNYLFLNKKGENSDGVKWLPLFERELKVSPSINKDEIKRWIDNV